MLGRIMLHISGIRLISLICVGLPPSEYKKCLLRFSSSCTCDVNFTLLTSVVLRTCCRLLNIPSAPAISGITLRKNPRSLYHLFFETLAARLVMTVMESAKFPLHVLGSVIIFCAMYIT